MYTTQYKLLCQWLNEKHHQCKLQLVTTTTCASGTFAPGKRRAIPQAQSAKARSSISASQYRMQHNMQLQPLPPPQLAQQDAAISATCLRVGLIQAYHQHHQYMQIDQNSTGNLHIYYTIWDQDKCWNLNSNIHFKYATGIWTFKKYFCHCLYVMA